MNINWKIDEIEWVNKIGDSQKVINFISYRCEAEEDSHTCHIKGQVDLLTQEYIGITPEEYNDIITQEGVSVKDHEEIQDFPKHYNEETEEWEGEEDPIITHNLTVYNFSSSETFTEYEDLTEVQVVAWVKSALGETKVTEIETSVTTILEEDLEMENKMFTHTSNLPWGNN